MNKIDINSITPDTLRNGIYRKLLPEYYRLQSLTENSPWHLNQNVFDHVVSVFENLIYLLELGFVSNNAETKIRGYLSSIYGSHTKRDLLMIATILHDIAKIYTLSTNSTGQTRCPGHEVIGSVMAGDFTNRFDLSSQEMERVQKIILLHGFMHDLLGLMIEKGDINIFLSFLKQAAPDFWIELLLLAYADMRGGDTKKSTPEDFSKREKLIIEFLA